MTKITPLFAVDWNQLADELMRQAEWRCEKALEFPDDAKRNNEAAKRFENIAVALRSKLVPFALLREFEKAARSDNCYDLWEEWTLQKGTILPPSSAVEFLAYCLKTWRLKSAA